MKKLLISAFFVLAAAGLFSSCTSVPQDSNANVRRDTSSRTTTYSK